MTAVSQSPPWRAISSGPRLPPSRLLRPGISSICPLTQRATRVTLSPAGRGLLSLRICNKQNHPLSRSWGRRIVVVSLQQTKDSLPSPLQGEGCFLIDMQKQSNPQPSPFQGEGVSRSGTGEGKLARTFLMNPSGSSKTQPFGMCNT